MTWLAWKLGCHRSEVSLIVERDDRFGCIACGTDVWWWSAAALAARNERPGEAR